MAALPLAIDGGRAAPAADRVPTLTEVVQLGQQAGADSADSAGVIGHAAPQPLAAAPAPQPLPDMDQLSAAVLAELQPRIEMLFEARVREAVAPALARAADGLIGDTRELLVGTLQALIQETVAKVLERRGQR